MLNIPGKICIEARGILKRFGQSTAVNRVSLQVYQNELFSLLGPSGCGKTTLLRLLGGLEIADAGNIFLSGADVTNVPAYRRNTNMIFQQLALFPHMDVFHNIAYGLTIKSVPKAKIQQRVEEVLSLVQLPEYGKRSVAQLSGGQAQRVAIARALVNRPKVLLLDEPLAALDMQLRLDMQRELKRIQRESGATFIFVTHDQNEALNISDRIGVMSRGNLLQVGTPNEIYERPADSFVAQFIGDTNLFSGKVLSIEGNYLLVDMSGVPSRILMPHEGIVRKGEEGSISIRYEYIRLGTEADSVNNRTTARVESVRYGGMSMHYSLVLTNGRRVSASVLNRPGKEPYQIGATVDIGWNPEDAVFLRSSREGILG